jgi:TP901 family phage tail tape measure protein
LRCLFFACWGSMADNQDRYGLQAVFDFELGAAALSNMDKSERGLKNIEDAVKRVATIVKSSDLGSGLKSAFQGAGTAAKQAANNIAHTGTALSSVGKALMPLKGEFRALRAESRNIDFGDIGDAKAFHQAKQSVAEYIAELKRLELQIQGDTAAEREFRAQLQREQRIAGDKIDLHENQRSAVIAQRRQGVAQSIADTGMQVAAPLIGAGIDSFNVFKSFDDQMLQVKAVLDPLQATADNMDKIRTKAKQLGAETRFSASEAASGFVLLAQAGYKVDQQMAAIGGTLNLAAAGNLGLAQATDITVSTLGQFQLQAGKANHVADVLAYAAGAGQLEVADLGETLKYAGVSAQSYGATLEQTAAMTALLSNAGIKGSMAGTALRTVFTSLAAPTTRAKSAMAELGVETVDDTGKLKSVDVVLGELNRSMAGLTEAEKIQKMKSIFGTEGSSAATYLASHTKDIRSMTRDALASSQGEGAAKRQAGIMESGIGGSMRSLSSAIEGLKIQFMEALNPAIKTTVDTISQLIRTFLSLPDPIKNSIAIAATLTAGIASLAVVLGTAAAAFFGLQAAIAEAGIASTVMRTGLIPLTGFFQTVTVAIGEQGLMGALVALGGGFTGLATTVTGFITGALALIFNPVTLAIGAILGLYAAIEYLTPGINVLGTVLSAIVAPLGFVWGLVKGIAEGIYQGLKPAIEVATVALSPFTGAMQAAFGGIGEAVGMAIASFTKMAASGEIVGQMIGRAIAFPFMILPSIANAAIDSIKTLWRIFAGWLTDILMAVPNSIKDSFENIIPPFLRKKEDAREIKTAVAQPLAEVVEQAPLTGKIPGMAMVPVVDLSGVTDKINQFFNQQTPALAPALAAPVPAPGNPVINTGTPEAPKFTFPQIEMPPIPAPSVDLAGITGQINQFLQQTIPGLPAPVLPAPVIPEQSVTPVVTQVIAQQAASIQANAPLVQAAITQLVGAVKATWDAGIKQAELTPIGKAVETGVQPLIDKLKERLSGVFELATGFSAKFSGALDGISKTMSGLSFGVGLFGIASLGAFSPMLLILGGIALTVLAIATNFLGLRTVLGGVIQIIGSLGRGIYEIIQGLVQTAKGVVQIFTSIGSAIRGDFSAIQEAAHLAFSGILRIGQGVANALTGVFRGAAQLLQGVFEGLEGIIRGTFGAIAITFKAPAASLQFIGKTGQAVFHFIESSASAAAALMASVLAAPEAAWKGFMSLLDQIQQKFRNLVSSISTAPAKAVETVKSKFGFGKRATVVETLEAPKVSTEVPHAPDVLTAKPVPTPAPVQPPAQLLTTPHSPSLTPRPTPNLALPSEPTLPALAKPVNNQSIIRLANSPIEAPKLLPPAVSKIEVKPPDTHQALNALTKLEHEVTGRQTRMLASTNQAVSSVGVALSGFAPGLAAPILSVSSLIDGVSGLKGALPSLKNTGKELLTQAGSFKSQIPAIVSGAKSLAAELPALSKLAAGKGLTFLSQQATTFKGQLPGILAGTKQIASSIAGMGAVAGKSGLRFMERQAIALRGQLPLVKQLAQDFSGKIAQIGISTAKSGFQVAVNQIGILRGRLPALMQTAQAFSGRFAQLGITAARGGLQIATRQAIALRGQLPAILQATQGFSNRLIQLGSTAAKGGFQIAIRQVGALRGQLPAVLGLVGNLRASVLTLGSTAVSALAPMMAAIVPFLPIIAGVGLAVGALYLIFAKDFLGIRSLLEGVIGVIGGMAGRVLSLLNPLNLISLVWQGIGLTVRLLEFPFTKILSLIGFLVTGALSLAKTIAGMGGTISTFLVAPFQKAGQVASGIGAGINRLLPSKKAEPKPAIAAAPVVTPEPVVQPVVQQIIEPPPAPVPVVQPIQQVVTQAIEARVKPPEASPVAELAPNPLQAQWSIFSNWLSGRFSMIRAAGAAIMPALAGSVQKGVDTVSAGVSSLTGIIGGISKQFSLAGIGAVIFGVTASAAFLPVTAIMAGVVLAGVAIATNFLGLRTVLVGVGQAGIAVFKGILGVISSTAELIQGIFNILAGAVTLDFERIEQGAKLAFDAVRSAAATLAETIKGIFAGARTAVGGILKGIGLDAERIAGKVKNTLSPIVGKSPIANIEKSTIEKSVIKPINQSIIHPAPVIPAPIVHPPDARLAISAMAELEGKVAIHQKRMLASTNQAVSGIGVALSGFAPGLATPLLAVSSLIDGIGSLRNALPSLKNVGKGILEQAGNFRGQIPAIVQGAKSLTAQLPALSKAAMGQGLGFLSQQAVAFKGQIPSMLAATRQVSGGIASLSMAAAKGGLQFLTQQAITFKGQLPSIIQVSQQIAGSVAQIGVTAAKGGFQILTRQAIALKGQLPAVIGMIGSLRGSLITLATSAISAMAPMMAAMMPFLPIIAGIALASGVLYLAFRNNFQGIRVVVGGLFNLLGLVGGVIFRLINPINLLSIAWQGVSAAARTITSPFGAALSLIGFLLQGVQAVQQAIAQIGATISTFLISPFQKAGQVISGITKLIPGKPAEKASPSAPPVEQVTTPAPIAPMVPAPIAPTAPTVAAAPAPVITPVAAAPVAQPVVEQVIQPVIKPVVQPVTPPIAELSPQPLKAAWTGFADWLIGKFDSIQSVGASLMGNLMGSVKQGGDLMGAGIQSLSNAIGGVQHQFSVAGLGAILFGITASTAFLPFTLILGGAVLGAIALATNFLGLRTVIVGIGQAGVSVFQGILRVAMSAVEFIQGAFSILAGAITLDFERVEQGVKLVFSGLQNTLSAFAETIQGIFRGMRTAIGGILKGIGLDTDKLLGKVQAKNQSIIAPTPVQSAEKKPAIAQGIDHQAKIKALHSEALNSASNLSNSLAGMLGMVAPQFAAPLAGFAAITSNIEGLITSIPGIKTAFGAILPTLSSTAQLMSKLAVQGFGALIRYAPILRASVISMIPPLMSMGAAVVGALMPILPVIAAVGAAVAITTLVFKTNFLGIRSAVELTAKIFGILFNAVTFVLNPLNILQGIASGIAFALTSAAQMIQGAWEGFAGFFGNLMGGLVGMGAEAGQGLINALNHSPTVRIPIAWSEAVQKIGGGLTSLVDAGAQTGGKLTGVLGAAGPLISQGLSKGIDIVISGIGSLIDVIGKATQQFFTAGAGAVFFGVTASTALLPFLAIMGGVVLAGVAIATNFLGIRTALIGIGQAGFAVFRGILQIAASVAEMIKGAFSILAGAITLDFERIEQGAKLIFNGIKSALSSLAQTVEGVFAGMRTTIGGILKGIGIDTEKIMGGTKKAIAAPVNQSIHAAPVASPVKPAQAPKLPSQQENLKKLNAIHSQALSTASNMSNSMGGVLSVIAPQFAAPIMGFAALTSSVEGLMQSLPGLKTAFGAITPFIASAGRLLSSLAGQGFTLLIKLAPIVRASMLSMIPPLMSVGAAIGTALLPALPIIAAVGAAVAVGALIFKTNFLGIRTAIEFTTGVFGTLFNAITFILNPLNILQGIASGVANTLSFAAQLIQGAWQGFGDWFGGLMGGLVGMGVQAGQGLINALNHSPTVWIPIAWDKAIHQIGGGFVNLVSNAAKSGNILTGLFSGVASSVEGAMSSALHPVMANVHAAWDASFGGIYTSFKNFFGNIAASENKLTGTFSAIGSVLTDTVGKALNNLIWSVLAFGASALFSFSPVILLLAGVGVAIYLVSRNFLGLRSIFIGVMLAISGAFEGLAQIVLGVSDVIRGTLQTLVSLVRLDFQGMRDAIAQIFMGFGQVFDGTASIMRAVFSGATRAVQGMFQALGQVINTVAGAIGLSLQRPKQAWESFVRMLEAIEAKIRGIGEAISSSPVGKFVRGAANVVTGKVGTVPEGVTMAEFDSELNSKQPKPSLINRLFKKNAPPIATGVEAAATPAQPPEVQNSKNLDFQNSEEQARGAVGQAANAITSLVSVVNPALGGLLGTISMVFSSVISLAGAIPALVSGLAAMGGITGIVSAGFAALGSIASVAWAAITGPMLPFIAGIGLVAGAIYLLYQGFQNNFLGIRTLVDGVFGVINAIIGNFIGSVMGIANEVWQSFNSMINRIGAAIGRIIAPVIRVGQALMNALAPLFGGQGDGGLGQVFIGIAGAITNALLGPLKLVAWVLEGIFNVIGFVADAVSFVLTPVVEGLVAPFQLIANIVQGIVSAVANIGQFAANLPVVGALFGGGNTNPETPVQKFAVGGLVAGSGKTDSVPAMLTPGEYVVNPAASRLFAPILEQMNSGATSLLQMLPPIPIPIPQPVLAPAGASIGGAELPPIQINFGDININIEGGQDSQQSIRASAMEFLDMIEPQLKRAIVDILRSEVERTR